MTKKTYIVGSTPIMHNGVVLPPGADIELSFDEYRSLGLELVPVPSAQPMTLLPSLFQTADALLPPGAVVESAAPPALDTAQHLEDPAGNSYGAGEPVPIVGTDAAAALPPDAASEAPPTGEEGQPDPAADPETLKPARRSSKKEGA